MMRSIVMRTFGPQVHASVLGRLTGKLMSESGLLFAGQMLGNAGAYLYHIIMARIMTPADYGTLLTLTSISYVLAVLVRTSQAWVIKAVAGPQGKQTEHVRNVLTLMLRLVLILGGAIAILFWLTGYWVADFLHLDSTTPVVALGFFVSTSSLISIPKGILLGVGRLRSAALFYMLNPLIRVAAGVVLVGWGLGVTGGLAAYAVGDIIIFATALLTLWPLLAASTEKKEPFHTNVDVDSYPVLILVANICLTLMSNIDQIAVKHFFPAEVAGHFSVAFLLGRVITMSTMALSWVVFARSARMSENDPGRIRLLVKSVAAVGSISIVMTTAYIIAPELVVRFMGGSQYHSAHSFVGLVGIEMTLFALVYVQAYFQMSLKRMQIIWPLCLATALEVILLAQYHGTIQQILINLILVTGCLLLCVSLLTWSSLRISK